MKIIRYAPKSLNAEQILDIVTQYGADNDSLLPTPDSGNTELWEIKITVKKVKNNGQSAN